MLFYAHPSVIFYAGISSLLSNDIGEEGIDMLEKWLSNEEENLKKAEEELKELEERKETDLERYELYSSKISEWLKEDIPSGVREELEYSFNWLNEQEEKINRDIELTKNRIETSKFIIYKLTQQ